MKSKMNRSKKRMKNKKGRNGNRSVKMRGGESIFNSYEKQFDNAVRLEISKKEKDLIKNIESLKETVTKFNSKIEKAYQQIDNVNVNKIEDPRLNAYLNNFNDAHGAFDTTYNNFVKSNVIKVLLEEAMQKALKTQNTAKYEISKSESSGKAAQKAVSDAQKAVSGAKKDVEDLSKKLKDATDNYMSIRRLNNGYVNDALTDASDQVDTAKNLLTDAQSELDSKQLVLTNAQTDSAQVAATEFLNNVSLQEATKLYHIIEKFLKKYDQDRDKLNTILFDNYKRDMIELIDEKKKMYNEIFKYKKNYTKLENEKFFKRIIQPIDIFTQYNILTHLYNNIANELKNIFNSDDSKQLLELADNINKYDLSKFKGTSLETAPPATRSIPPAPAPMSLAATGDKEYKKSKNKITDININFYKSNFENNNPFPHYEQVVLNRSGQGVISDLYGVEELFPTFKEELQYIADPTKKDIFKPFNTANIKIEHKKNDKNAPTLDFLNK
jgi:hypothetical protein